MNRPGDMVGLATDGSRPALRPARRRLRLRFLAPLVAAGLAATVLAIVIAHALSAQMVGMQVRRRAEALHAALAHGAGSVEGAGRYQGFVSALGAGADITRIVVAAGAPARVVAATRREWVGRMLADLDLPAEDPLVRDLSLARLGPRWRNGDGECELVAPLRSSAGGADGLVPAGAVAAIRLDTGALWRDQTRQAWLGGGFALLAVLGLAAWSWRLLQRLVMEPVAEVAEAMERRRAGDRNARAPQRSEDEIGRMAAMLNRALDTQDASQAHWQALIDRLPDAVVVHKGGRCVFVNDRAVRLLGAASPAAVLGREVLALVHVDDHERVSACHQALIDGGTTQPIVVRLLRDDGYQILAEVSHATVVWEDRSAILVLVRDITEQQREAELLAAAHAETELLLATLSAALIGLDTHDRISRWNAAAERLFACPAAQVMGRTLEGIGIGCDWSGVRQAAARCVESGRPQEVTDLRYRQPAGGDGLLAVTVDSSWATSGDGSERLGMVLLVRDITEPRRREMQQQQGAKLESIGQLAAGIAHEINTPVQFIGDNLRYLADAARDLIAMQAAQGRLIEALRPAAPADLLAAADRAREVADPEFTAGEIPKAIQQSLEGVERVASLAKAMKAFSHPDQGKEKQPTDINQVLMTTLTVARNEYKYVATVATDLDPGLPPVPCLGEISQVFLNLLVNAAHAIADVVAGSGSLGTITVGSRRVGPWCEVRIADTGTGIPDSVRHRMFEPFFTTKPVGKGTGQGLSISRNIVVRGHGGELDFEPREGGGTVFVIRLPLAEARHPAAADADAGHGTGVRTGTG